MSRYQVVLGSESAHCCFDYSIVDSLTSDDIYNKVIVEGFELEDAEWVAEALNDYNNLWHENMATEVIVDMVADYIESIGGDLYHAFGDY